MDDSSPPAAEIPSSGRAAEEHAAEEHGAEEAVIPDSVTNIWHVDFAACYEAEMPVLVRYLIKCGADPHDAVDAAQDAFRLLFEQWPSVHYPKAWLRTVAYRTYLQRPVSGKTSLNERQGDQPHVLPASTRIEIAEEEEEIIAMFRQLPLMQRQVFALYFDNFNVREISEILSIKEAAVRQNLARARATLRRMLCSTRRRFG